ncbi:MAG: hypothetical protein ACI8RD_004601 [Bacillariaceae sp.]|jgi:hypothetical protein
MSYRTCWKRIRRSENGISNPTTYGADRGRTYTKQQFCRECDIDIYGPNGPCGDPDIPGSVTYEDALNYAWKLRDENEWFTDHTYTNIDMHHSIVRL